MLEKPQAIAMGAAAIAIGAVYIRWPDLFRRGIWRKTAIAQRLLSERGHRIYMQGFGVVLIVAGAGLIA